MHACVHSKDCFAIKWYNNEAEDHGYMVKSYFLLKSWFLGHVWLCNTMDCSQPGSPVHGILRARVLEWVAILFSRGSSWPRDLHYRQILYNLSHQGISGFKASSRVWLFATPWSSARQAPLSMGFPRQEYWSGLPFPSAEDLPRGWTQVTCIAGRFFTAELPGKVSFICGLIETKQILILWNNPLKFSID